MLAGGNEPGGDDHAERVIGDPLTGHTGPVYAVAFGRLDDRPVIASGSDGETGYGTPPPVRRPHHAVTSAAFGQVNGRLAFASGSVRLWDAAAVHDNGA